MRRFIAVSFLSLAASLLLSCGGGKSEPPTPPPSPIAVTVSGTSGVLNTGATRKFSATVTNASNLAVTWSVVEADGGTITSDGVYTAPALPGTFTVKATAQADTSASGTAIVPVVIPVGHVDGYEVGVNYHSTTSDNIRSAFITTYNQPQVRQTVRAQLQGMADRGATLISTRIWFMREPGTTVYSDASATTFPMSDQEQANLRTYAQDVAAIQGSGGNRLQLDVDLLWLAAADYTKGSPATGLGYTPGYPPISASEFTSRVELTTDKVLIAISGVNRPDGVPVARMVYLEGGVMLGLATPNDPPPVPNQDWFMSTHYPRFVSKVLAAGFQPSVYFVVGYDSQDSIFDNTWVDPMYPVLNGRRSMYWMYRSLKFMVDRGMYIPPRIDFAYYVYSTGAPYSDILSRVLSDTDVIVPLVTGKTYPYGIAEAFYILDSTQRRQYGQAFVSEALASHRFQFVAFWTSPDGAVPGQDVGYPFAIEDYLPPPAN
jgi:hypothetical protein